ncbi:hypothetical protein EYF80_061296 [Liparis tanakae]|uniref:Uncharacterized protein n=1 Tax=Liparis tanakae TaxID=230148 RepID=A0A4Z2EI85_9TELE|nr:hypothetical protein EYF80_061296 [Liparis tanakae]
MTWNREEAKMWDGGRVNFYTRKHTACTRANPALHVSQGTDVKDDSVQSQASADEGGEKEVEYGNSS